ncbi:hypothetical protein EDI_310140 [Entamoeba dispar SAW760]|uniref:Uncharacterized protein n=1 Tax=Entamoeba dispar (strain ATCC PRA-260 / SAW760) TaxID=370354 RepID=B0ENU4_ENTDS|nr:uncharacterized protein EDI_310140 [Entamoeba dispar SAW760]EDR23783.1 hypothetical protein EDI_310140 [Entamoeba dispar SAW760]|eukprot:EDR23783.1 hypothetical protein EDI_310140 [Entamoeba dispar SAW760]
MSINTQNNTDEPVNKDFSYLSGLIRILADRYPSFLPKFIESSETIYENEITKDWFYINFQKRLNSLNSDTKKKLKDKLVHLFKIQAMLSDLNSSLTDVSIDVGVSLKEHYNNALKVIKISGVSKEDHFIKIPVGYGCPKHISIGSTSIKIRIHVNCPDDWKLNGLDIIHYVSDDELQNRSFVFLSGKTLSLSKFNKEMTISGYGLRSKERIGNLVLKTRNTEPHYPISHKVPTTANYNTGESQRKVSSGIIPSKNSINGLYEAQSYGTQQGNTAQERDQNSESNNYDSLTFKISSSNEPIEIKNITYYPFILNNPSSSERDIVLRVNIHTDYMNEINEKETFEPKGVFSTDMKEDIILCNVLFGNAFKTIEELNKFIDDMQTKFNLKYFDCYELNLNENYVVLDHYLYKTLYGFIPLIYPIPKNYRNTDDYKNWFFVFFNYLHPSNEISAVIIHKKEKNTQIR